MNEEKANILVFPAVVLISVGVAATSLPVVYHCLDLVPLSHCSSTVTPTIGLPVELQCSGSGVGKQWYTTGSEVTPTLNQINTSACHL